MLGLAAMLLFRSRIVSADVVYPGFEFSKAPGEPWMELAVVIMVGLMVLFAVFAIFFIYRQKKKDEKEEKLRKEEERKEQENFR